MMRPVGELTPGTEFIVIDCWGRATLGTVCEQYGVTTVYTDERGYGGALNINVKVEVDA